MIATENKKTIQFKQSLPENTLMHDLQFVNVNGGKNTRHYHTPLAVAKFIGNGKIMSCFL
jgi:5-methylcytosine-specific restriction endonuclease McrBC regulatory subunit McrC